ncbi:helix-turn-helix domain-containing protein [Lactobacillus taiwanensis]|uniref:helix-turn-helix domain-containing protein n=1 Tax=Lactobacillus taiwanensis TaxID=508451 RepID=UPI000B98A65D|nr:helix-turn-helix transcriptional regulator [Lactobacillus taiwanensis]OYS16241.1 transcriptional regulator [Lactobacillus taiwanensis]OYS16438.1 transcriptional regulator [Lactobacillus taiwanensis]OYS32374.1 transcriptional regulator [Lactobacillus taiwanensis]OYS33142.1 transcriptional regulator [Lactobacillus taiwanensis]OYS33933.1 transcriptional regulator [Lactobacillus taiwanensis]
MIDDKMTLAKKIINLREDRDMSQIELAEKTGIERTALNKIERGTRKVSSDELKALAKAFNISSDSLLDLSTHSSKNELNYEDFGLPYKGVISEDLNDTFRLLAQQYAEKHNLPKKDQ